MLELVRVIGESPIADKKIDLLFFAFGYKTVRRLQDGRAITESVAWN
jgi:hypothetical protein